MIARLRAAGVGASVAELITTPLAQQRHRLNGSAILVVRPPAGTLTAIAAAASAVGAACATEAGTWSFRLQTWSGATSPVAPARGSRRERREAARGVADHGGARGRNP